MAFNRKAYKKEYDREYQQRPEVIARRRARQRTPESKAKARARRNATPYNFVRYKVLAMRSAAKKRGLVWELDIDATIAKILRQGHCKLSGVKFVYKQGGGKKNIFSPSIDRIDSRKGYVPGNVMFVCWGVNVMKHEMSLYQFKKMCARVAA